MVLRTQIPEALSVAVTWRPSVALVLGKIVGNNLWETFNYLGDPELMLRTTIPRGLHVSVDTSVAGRETVTVYWDADGQPGDPVHCAQVAISSESSAAPWAGLTDGDGAWSWDVGGTGTYDLVVTAHDARPYIGSIGAHP